MSSSAIPFAFPSQHWEFEGSNLVAMDGGSVWNINLASAVQRCQEIVGEDESKITIDILDCGTSKLSDYHGDEKSNTINNFFRFKELKSFNEDAADLGEIMAAFPKVNYRYYVSPSQALGTMAVMDGTNATCTFPMQQIGRKDGANAVKKGEGYHHKKIMEWRESKEIQKTWPKLNEYIVHLNDNGDADIEINCKLNLFEPAPQNEEFLQK